MNKKYIVSLLVVLSLVLTGVANAASTIGTNMSTTGTFTVTPATDSATSIRFQNTAGTSFFVADSTNLRVGIGAAPSTTFEVQGTASASYFLTSNTIQVGSLFASVAYSRFGAGSTGHSLSAAQDVLFSGLTEVDGNAFFDAKVGIGGATSTVFEVQGTASASYFLTGNTIQVGGFASVAYSRFGTAATTHSNYITTTNDLLINGDFEVDASAQFDSFVQMDTTATTSFSIRSTSATQGACIELKDDDGTGYTYLRVSNGAAKFSTVSCK